MSRRCGETPLLAAIRAGSEPVVSRLLDAVDSSGDTALMAAARNGDTAICGSLLSAGANPRLRNREHATAAELAEARGFAALAERLRG